MILEQITLEGFLSYRSRQSVIFDGDGVYLVNGSIDGDLHLSNGAGKSGLFEAILVNFWGKAGGRGEKIDSYINDESDQMFVEIIFRVDDIRYKSVMAKSRTSSTNHEIFYQDNEEWKKTDKTIDDILGLGILTFSSTVYLSERETTQFIDGTGSERKEIFRELLNIQQFEEAANICNKRINELDKKITVNISVIQNYKDDLDKEKEYQENLKTKKQETDVLEKKENKAKESLKIVEKEKKEVELQFEKIKTIKETIESENETLSENEETLRKNKTKIKNLQDEKQEQTEKYENENEILKQQIASKDKVEKKLTDLKEQEKGFIEVESRYKELTNQSNTIRTSVSKDQIEQSKLKTQIEQLDKLIQKIDKFGNICPISEQECSIINVEYRETFKEEKTTEKTKLETKSNKNSDIIKKNELNLTKIERELETCFNKIKTKSLLIQQISKVEIELNNINNAQSSLKTKEENFKSTVEKNKKVELELEEEKKKTEQTIEKRKEKIKDLKTKIDLKIEQQLEKITQQFQSLTDDIDDLKEKIKQEEGKIIVLVEKLKRITEIKKQIETLMKDNDQLMRRKRIFLELTKVFGKEGIQKAIMKDSVPFLEKSACEILKIFNNDSEKLKIKFDLDPRTASGDLKKGGGLDILVFEEGKEPKDLKMYSGGERVRSIFSVILGLSKLLSLRSGKKHDTMIIDEKIAKLDRKGIEQFSEIITNVSQWYKKVFIITHIESLKEMIGDYEILVNKTDNEGSTITIT